MLKKTIVYFTRVDIGRIDNGGALVCRNHARRIAELNNVELIICTAGPQSDFATVSALADSIGASHEPIAFLDTAASPAQRWPMMFESESLAQSHIDGELNRLLDRTGARILVVDYLYSALFIP